ncbi:MAG: lipoprotein [Bradyrhizobiaceae bacterium]|nr:lipoprotein [Bradyrhizobiaceae bacterium]
MALAAALTAALGLAACGRKGPLDPPPSASLPQAPTTYTSRPGLGEERYGVAAAGGGAQAAPAPRAAPAPAAAAPAPPPQEKTFFLDFLLGK